MKKYIYLSLAFVLGTLLVFADDAKFANALQNCSSYSESGVVSADGLEVTARKQILGWESGKCIYKEKLSFSGVDSEVLCKFTKPQVQELSSVINAYSLVQQYTNEKIDTSSSGAVQNNPVVRAWNKYLQDGSVCSVNMLK